jgi:N-acyl-D-aspartate/D-glutamate deacylase
MAADYTIRNATIVDGSGEPGYTGDVSIEGDRIVAVGKGQPADTETDGTGLVVAPGFVDTHSHDDGAFIRYPGMEFKLAQGVTTDVSGNCGFSAAPNVPGETPPGGSALRFPGPWEDLDGYFAECQARGPAINNMMLIGHNTIRGWVMGNERREPTSEELAKMRAMVERGMEQGACGFSTGLIYEPGRYSQTPEVVELATVAANFGGLYATHMRNEGDHLLDAIEETLDIGRRAGCPVHISHHKAAGRANWGRCKESLERIDRAIADGQEATLDIYPYVAGSGPMHQYFRLDNISMELAEAIRIASCPDHPDWEGRMLKDIAADEGIALDEAVRRAITGPRGTETICIQFTMDEQDVETNLRHPRVMIGSDGIPNLNGSPHPRLFGTFPRVLGRYVRERRILPLEDAVRRMTSLPCERFGIADRGFVREGLVADLVVFNPDTVIDRATWDKPKVEPEGVERVFVSGKLAYDRGKHTGAGAGKMLRYRRN